MGEARLVELNTYLQKAHVPFVFRLSLLPNFVSEPAKCTSSHGFRIAAYGSKYWKMFHADRDPCAKSG